MQLHQDYAPAHGDETPAEVPAAGVEAVYDTAMRAAPTPTRCRSVAASAPPNVNDPLRR